MPCRLSIDVDRETAKLVREKCVTREMRRIDTNILFDFFFLEGGGVYIFFTIKHIRQGHKCIPANCPCTVLYIVANIYCTVAHTVQYTYTIFDNCV